MHRITSFRKFLILAAALVTLTVPAVAHADSPHVYPSNGNWSTVFCLFAGGFIPNEEIALWVQLSDGTVIDEGTATANSSGAVGRTEGEYIGYACISGEPTWSDGEALLVAQGKSSHVQASGKFLYQGDFAKPGSSAGVQMSEITAPPINTPYFSFTASGFAAYERVSKWLGNPDGSVTDLGDDYADEHGNVYQVLTPFRRPGPGEYTMVFHGARGQEYSHTFTFLGIDNPLPTAPGITVNPSGGTSFHTFFVINGAGFQPYEAVSVWLAEPDGTTYTDGTEYANENGLVKMFWNSYGGEPTGVYTVVMVGQERHLRLTGTFTVYPMPESP